MATKYKRKVSQETADFIREELTEKQKVVLAGKVAGKSFQAIADELGNSKTASYNIWLTITEKIKTKRRTSSSQ
jgi:DNA-binding NarL/FixJ family response regulator